MRLLRCASLLGSIALSLVACGDDDAPSDTDAGTRDMALPDAACGPSPCGAPAEGCHYEGATCTSCGTIVCEDGGPMSCVLCAPPPDGCRYDGGSCASCGTLVCEDAGVDAGNPPVACGGRAGDPCSETEYCRYDVPSSCSRDDSQGECTAIPESCPPGGEPVCGCDGMRYASECAAAMARTGIITDGTTC